MMSPSDEDMIPPPARKSLRRRLITRGLITLILGLAIVAVTGMLLAGRVISVPPWALQMAEARLERALEDRVRVSVGGVDLRFSYDSLPEVRLTDLSLRPREGTGRALLPEVVARFSGRALLAGRIEARELRVSGTQLSLRRKANGDLDVDLGGAGRVEAPSTIAEIMARIDSLFALPLLAKLTSVDLEGLTLTLDDRRADRLWTIGDGQARLNRTVAETQFALSLGLVSGGEAPATAQMTFAIGHGGTGARVAVRVDNVAAADLAAQGPVLAWLGILQAPISGDLHAALDGQGAISGLEGRLQIGQGALQPAPGIKPLPLNAATLGLSYDVARARLRTDLLEVDSPTLRLRATGHADVQPDGAYVTQIAFQEVQIDPEGVFTEPMRFGQGALDLRLRLDPFSVDVGQLSLQEEGRTLLAKGGVHASEAGWTLALDVELDRIRHDRLLALWPVALVPKTRDWLVGNVQQGELFDVKAGIRLRPGQEPRMALGYEFRDADVRFMPTLPPIKQGRGYASIEGTTYLTVVEDGVVEPPLGGQIDVARSVFRVPDVTQRPPLAEITLQTSSSLTAALSLLDQPPFSFLTKAGMSPELGEGRADLSTRLLVPLKAKVLVQEVEFAVEGQITDLRSDRLVPGRSLSAAQVQIEANAERLRVFGPARLGEARFEGAWTLPLRGETRGQSRFEGQVRLDDGFSREFLGSLGGTPLRGQGMGTLTVDLVKGAAPRLSLRSDLRGVAVSIAELGWSKPAESRGRLEVEGALRSPIRLDRLLLEGPGLSVQGQVQMAASGALERLDVRQIRMGDWLEARAEVIGQGRGRAPLVRVTGGRADLRRLPANVAGGGGARGGAAPQIALALDRVQISESLVLTRVQGSLSPQAGGVDGRVSGLLNGAAPVEVRLVPGPRGTSVRVRSEDAGGALRASGLFAKVHGGVMDLALMPSGPAGHYTGTVSLADFRVRDMPALAQLLNAASIVGLIEQLSSSGLAFGVASGSFRLTPDAMELTGGQAVGASFGVSLDGVYYSRQDRLDLQGVISPFYLLNGIGALLTRPGEGLMGFTYRIRGSAKAPDVSVNPFSVLAPGFFRDLLRRPAARIDE